MTELEELVAKRNTLSGRLAGQFFGVIALLLAPPVLLAFIGNYLKAHYNTPSLLTFIFCSLSECLALYIVYKVYKRIDSDMVELDTKIHNIKITNKND